jgi:serine/threonine-protein kinase
LKKAPRVHTPRPDQDSNRSYSRITVSGGVSRTDPGSDVSPGSGRLRSRGMQYRRLMLLGTGGMATVHLALAMGPGGFNRLVVVKAIREELLAQPSLRGMFLDEARICARLNHPNVVQVSEVIDSPAGVMIVMEYLDGQPLSVLNTLGEQFTLAMRLRVVCEVLTALHYVHELSDFEGEPLGLVHRDVSPQNIYLTFDGRVKLLDFGIAKANVSERTETGVMKGKLAYMPAEQLRGLPVDRRSDIYSVGCILWETIAGSRLWGKRPDRELMMSVLKGELPELGERVQVDPRLEQIVKRAMALSPADRYSTADEMRIELEALLSTTTPVSPREIGEMLSLTFSDAHQSRQAEIARLIAELPDSNVGEDNGTRFQASVTKSEIQPQPTRRRWLWALLAIVAASAITIVAQPLRRAPSAPVASGQAVVTAVAAAAASDVALSISVTPRTASVSIDGVTLATGDAITRFAPNTEHVIRVVCDGYSSVERRVTLSADTSMAIVLNDLTTPSANPAVAERAPEKRAKPSGTYHPLAAAPKNAPSVKAVPAASEHCSPPYYFVGGIKKFKPECI